MYQLEWANEREWKHEAAPQLPVRSHWDAVKVSSALLLRWEEHCLECAPPQCYQTCLLYHRRPDGSCRNLVYGMYADRRFTGMLRFGVDVRFRVWGKIEAQLISACGTVSQHRLYQRIDAFGAAAVRAMSRVAPAFLRDKLAKAMPMMRKFAAERMPRHYSRERLPDAFIFEGYSMHPEPFRIIVEYRNDTKIKHRTSFEVKPGHNYHSVNAEEFHLEFAETSERITVYPEDNIQARVVITWLDFVSFEAAPLKAGGPPAAKVKCVAWDLDNTLWQGTLIEDGTEKLRPNAAAIEAIKQLDARGILQTIVSKNNHNDAWAFVTKLGLDPYFLYPVINWKPKSEGLQQIASELNINLNTFALIDDSAFERAEVKAALPQIRTYSNEEIPGLLHKDEFDVLVTEEGKKRRLSYRTELERRREQKSFAGDYETFLRSCEMKIRVFVPQNEADVRRCLELIQRSNQLNLSARAITGETLQELLADPQRICVALSCQDKFGDYGLVGFVNVNTAQPSPLVEDFVISCRIAQKHVEEAFFHWLSHQAAIKQHPTLRARLIKTGRNTPLQLVLQELKFQATEEAGNNALLEVSVARLGNIRPTATVSS